MAGEWTLFEHPVQHLRHVSGVSVVKVPVGNGARYEVYGHGKFHGCFDSNKAAREAALKIGAAHA